MVELSGLLVVLMRNVSGTVFLILAALVACSRSTEPQPLPTVPVPVPKLAPEQELTNLVAQAGAGQADAQYDLGNRHEKGDGVTQDATKAVDWWQKAASQGNAQAQSKLGFVFQWGLGVKQDAAKALEMYEKAAIQGNADAQYAIGAGYLVGKENAMVGLGLPKDYAKAFEWLRKSAEQGNAKGQGMLSLVYINGSGVPKNEAKAFEWMLKAAAQGDPQSQSVIAFDYETGKGVTKDLVLAYAWYNLAASKIHDVLDKVYQIKRDRDKLEERLTPSQRAEGQRLASSWKHGDIIEREGNATGDQIDGGSSQKKGTGSGVFVSENGYILTNHHVIEKCGDIRIAGQDVSVKVIASDAANDIALLKGAANSEEYAVLPPESYKLKQGNDVVVFGYPLNSVLSSGGNLTPGIISAMTGLNNNTSQIQITAPIQPGSSGSPVVNKKGHLIGLVSMKLSDAAVARATGSLPQNANFAVSAQTVRSFLDANKVAYKTASTFVFMEKNNADIAEAARKWTIIVECWSRARSASSATAPH